MHRAPCRAEQQAEPLRSLTGSSRVPGHRRTSAQPRRLCSSGFPPHQVRANRERGAGAWAPELHVLGQPLGEGSSTDVGPVQVYHPRSCALPIRRHPRGERPQAGEGLPFRPAPCWAPQLRASWLGHQALPQKDSSASTAQSVFNQTHHFKRTAQMKADRVLNRSAVRGNPGWPGSVCSINQQKENVILWEKQGRASPGTLPCHRHSSALLQNQ